MTGQSPQGREVPAELTALLLDGSAFELVSHVRGDADAACVFALARVLRGLGKRVAVRHDMPPQLSWLVPAVPAVADDGGAPGEGLHEPGAGPVLTIALDTGNYARLALRGEERARIDALVRECGAERDVPLGRWQEVREIACVVDHHLSNQGYGHVNWVVPDASSTSELLVWLILALERETGRALLDPEVCWRLFAGIVADVNWFRRPADAFAHSAALLLEERAPIDKEWIAAGLETRSEGYFRLGETLRREFRRAGGVVWSLLDEASIKSYGVHPDEAASLLEELERVEGSLFVLFVEVAPGEIRVRLRGRGVPVIGLAKAFGGGGHEYRAGATVHSRDEALRVVDAAGDLLQNEGRRGAGA